MISKSAYNKTGFCNNLLFTKSARDAWKLILNSIKKHDGHLNILLPAYIGFTDREGSGIFDPVQSTQAKFSFYKVDDKLSIDFDDLKKVIETENFNVLLAVHYFGYCKNDLKMLKDLCIKHNIYLVEDCAHAFHIGRQDEGLGITGDFSFYSVHKYLPVTTGGILKNISNRVALLPIPDEDVIALEVTLSLLQSDLPGIAVQRISNFNLYNELLQGINGLELMYHLDKNEIPQTFAVRIKNGLRESLYFHLMELNMPTTALYYRLIDDLKKEDYPVSHSISNEILNLPLHQDTTAEDITALTSEIRKFLNQHNSGT